MLDGTGECVGARARRDAFPPTGAAAVTGRGMRLDPVAIAVAVAVAVDSLTAQRLNRELPPPAVAGRAFFDRWPGVSLFASGAAGRSCKDDSRRLLHTGERAARQTE